MSFSPRNLRDWNLLPPDIVELETPEAFKPLRPGLYEHQIQKYHIDIKMISNSKRFSFSKLLFRINDHIYSRKAVLLYWYLFNCIFSLPENW
jgi:hypothetical protein